METQSRKTLRSSLATEESLAELTVEAAKADGVWLDIRSTRATTGMPLRWHTDSFYFTPAADQEYLTKVVFVSKGQCSLFCKLPDPQRLDRIYELQYALAKLDWSEMEERAKVQGEINERISPEEVIQPQTPFKAALFAAGPKEVSALHSEPDFTEDRIYTQIVPCSFAQMDELHRRFAAL